MNAWQCFITQAVRPRLTGLTLLAGLFFVHIVHAQPLTVRVGVYDNAPKLLLTKDGAATGIVGEILQEIAHKEKWNVEAVPCLWQDCLDKLQTGQIDLLPDVAYTPERSGLYGFHQVPLLHNWSQVYAKPNTVIRSVLDLQGKHVVALTGSVQYQFTKSLTDSFGVEVQLTGVPRQEDGFIKVGNNEADAVVASYYYGETHANIYGIVATSVMFEPTRSFYITKKNQNQSLRDAIDRHLGQWQDDPESVYFTILQQWGKPPAPTKIPAAFWWAGAAILALLALALSIAALLRQQIARQTRHLKARETWLDTVLESVDAFIYIKDHNFRYKYCNHKSYDFFGLPPSEFIGRTDDEIFPGQPILASIKKNDTQIMSKGVRVIAEDDIVALSRNSSTQMLVTVKQPMLDSTGQISGICGISTDITQLKEAREKVHQLAYYDTLTKLPNRPLLLDKLSEAMQEAAQNQFSAAILFIDLDDFKKLNDARGHQSGDILLRSVGNRLRSMAQAHDTVARIGGDEFVMLLTHLDVDAVTATVHTLQTAETIRAALQQPFDIEGQPFRTGASIGMTMLGNGEKSVQDVLREADTAMYRSKAIGRNRVSLYEASMQAEIEQRLSLENDIVQAITEEQFQVHIQAQFDGKQQVIGAELLLRWHHPVRGMVPPGVFIPVAEQIDAIVPIGEWTLRQACLILTQPPLAQGSFPLSINVSASQFKEPNFTQRVKQILHETNAPANRLLFEITEGVLIDNLSETLTRIGELSELGIRFSIDDFGTGYSNLSTLKALPLFELKIDQSLIQGVPQDPNSTVIVRLIIEMGHQLDLQVVAEGVETSEQADFLIENGCDALQGYLFMRPMPLSEWKL